MKSSPGIKWCHMFAALSMQMILAFWWWCSSDAVVDALVPISGGSAAAAAVGLCSRGGLTLKSSPLASNPLNDMKFNQAQLIGSFIDVSAPNGPIKWPGIW